MKKILVNVLTLLLLAIIIFFSQKFYLYNLVYRPLSKEQQYSFQVLNKSINNSTDNVVLLNKLYVNKNFFAEYQLNKCKERESGGYLYCNDSLVIMYFTDTQEVKTDEFYYLKYGLYKISYNEINKFFGNTDFTKKYNMAAIINKEVNFFSSNSDLKKKIAMSYILMSGDYTIYTSAPRAVVEVRNNLKSYSIQVEVDDITYGIYSNDKKLFDDLLQNIYFDID